MKLTTKSIFLLSLMVPSMASAATLLVDFTTAGNSAAPTGLTFSSQDIGGTGVSFDITASAVIPSGGGANNGDIVRLNEGLGSTVENVGEFLNIIGGTSEVLRFTISNVTGLLPHQSIQISDLLSQNVRGTSANQSGGYGGTFGNVATDSVTLTSDNTSSFVINQSDAGDLGSSLLNGDNGNTGNTGNTFEHGAGNLTFTTSFDVALTGPANDAIVIQGFDFVVVPEPSSTALLGLGGLALILRRRK